VGESFVRSDVSLSDGVIEYAKTHEEIKGAFLTFQEDSDQIYPGWKEELGYTGESSVQAATCDWQKKVTITTMAHPMRGPTRSRTTRGTARARTPGRAARSTSASTRYAKTHEEIKGAFLNFQTDSDQIYPGWKEKAGLRGRVICTQ